MSNIRNITKNFIALSLAQAISTVLSLVLVIFLTRFLGDAGYGQLSFAVSLASILTILTPLGLDQLMIREVARNKSLAARYLGNTLVVELAMSVVSFILIALTAWLMHLSGDSATVLYIIGGYCILTIFSTTFKTIFRAYEKMEYEAALTAIRSFITVAAGIAVVLLGGGLLPVAYTYVLAAAIELVLSVVICLKHFVHPVLKIDPAFWRQMIPIALPFAILVLLAATYTQIDIIILRSIQGDAVVGWYKAATALVYTFNIIPGILSSAIFPAMSRFYVDSRESLKFTLQKMVKYLLILAFPITAGILILAEPIINMFYGANFINAVPALRLLALYIPFAFLNSALGVMLNSTDKQRLRLFCYLGSTLIRIAFNLLLISRLSLTGAAIACFSSEMVLFILNYYFSQKYVPGLNIPKTIIKPLLATIGMAFIVYLMREMNLILVVITAAIAYFALIFAAGGFDTVDKNILKEVWRGIKNKTQRT